MKILLIAGHGAGDPGAIGTIKGKIYREAEETRKVVAKLEKLLSQYAEVTVYPTDRDGFSDSKTGALSTIADFRKYDHVLEIHFNAFRADSGDGKIKGTEIYVTTSELGIAVEQGIVGNIAALGFTNRGVKRKNFNVINAAKKAGVSSALLEVCFIDDADDMELYLSNEDAVAQAVAGAIISGFKLFAPTDNRKIVQEKAGLEDSTMDYLASYEYGDELLKKLAAAMK